MSIESLDYFLEMLPSSFIDAFGFIFLYYGLFYVCCYIFSKRFDFAKLFLEKALSFYTLDEIDLEERIPALYMPREDPILTVETFFSFRELVGFKKF